jgi:hypothetical protein
MRQILAVLLAAAPALGVAQAQYAPPPQYAPAPPAYAPATQAASTRHQRDAWYVTFAAGSGSARLTFKDPPNGIDETLSLSELYGGDTPTRMAFDVQVGSTITPQLLLGVDLGVFVATGNLAPPSHEAHLSLSIGTLTFNATVFPWRTGPFVRGGLGVARFASRATFPSAPAFTTEAFGMAGTAGVGYAFWVGQRLNLTLSLDVSGQTYPESDAAAPDTSSYWALRGGIGWY